MLIPLEILLLMTSFFLIGFSHARRCLSTIILAILFWILSNYITYFINKSPFPPTISSLSQEYTALVITFSIILFSILILFGIPYLAGYCVGHVVNNVEKYQRK